MYFVYILVNPQNKLYVGCTLKLQKRLERHNLGLGAEFTKRNKNFKLIYFEEYTTLLQARRREHQIKGWRREKKDNLIKYGKPIV